MWESPKILVFIGRWRRPLWLTYIGEKETTLHKTYGIKLWCYQKDLRIHIENTKTPIPPSPTLSTQKNLGHFDQGYGRKGEYGCVLGVIERIHVLFMEIPFNCLVELMFLMVHDLCINLCVVH